jgi:hypothetical protein
LKQEKQTRTLEQQVATLKQEQQDFETRRSQDERDAMRAAEVLPQDFSFLF